MGQFTLVILWRDGTSGMEEGLSWPDVMRWMDGIYSTASQDLVQQVLIQPVGVDPMRIVARQKTKSDAK